MSPEGTKRKLTAILSADVQGYSRLMEDDEEATVATLTSHREVMSKVIEKHSGRVVDTIPESTPITPPVPPTRPSAPTMSGCSGPRANRNSLSARLRRAG
jgi:class 3 adenylate cyclase